MLMTQMHNIDTLENYEDICEAARDARENMDDAKWIIGDLAVKVGMSYGDNLIGNFARDIGVGLSTIKRYRKTSAFYEKDKRVAFFNIGENLFYSHFAAVAGKMSLEDAYEFLIKASEEGWTIDQTADQLRDKKAGELEKITEFLADNIRILPDGTILITPCAGYNPAEIIDRKNGRQLTVRMYAEKPIKESA